MRLGARGDEIVRGLDAPAVDVQGGPVDEARVAVEELDAVLVREVDVLVAGACASTISRLPAISAAKSTGPASVRDAGEAGSRGAMARLGRRQQRLGRDAADVHARPADRAALDHRHAQLAAARCDRRRERAAARADDRQVVVEPPPFSPAAPISTASSRCGGTRRRARRCPPAVPGRARAARRRARRRSGSRRSGARAESPQSRTSAGTPDGWRPSAATGRGVRRDRRPTARSCSRSSSRIRTRVGSPSPRKYLATRSGSAGASGRTNGEDVLRGSVAGIRRS